MAAVGCGDNVDLDGKWGDRFRWFKSEPAPKEKPHPWQRKELRHAEATSRYRFRYPYASKWVCSVPLPAPQLDVFAQRFWEPLVGKPTAVSLDAPEVPPARPVLTLVEPQPPKPKRRRASGPRMERWVSQAVLRAIAAGRRYLHSGDTLKEAACASNSNVHYVRAVLGLWATGQTALLKAAILGDIALLTAAQTRTATNIAVITNN